MMILEIWNRDAGYNMSMEGLNTTTSQKYIKK